MRLLSLLALLLLLTPTPFAAGFSTPLDIEADTLDVAPSDGKATFSGNVKLTQDGMTLNANTLKLNSATGNTLQTAIASGNVKLTFSGGSATGNKATWHTAKNEVILTGNVNLTQAGNTLTGETLTYDLTNKQARLSSGNSGRVKATFTPTQ